MSPASERPLKRSLTLRGHRTSVSLEPAFWAALRRLAAARGVSINALAAEIDDARARRDQSVSLASALRCAILEAAIAGTLSAARAEPSADVHSATAGSSSALQPRRPSS